MIQQPEILGAHGWFFRDGAAFTVPEAGTTGREVKPGAADPLWHDFGIIDVSITPEMGAEIEIWKSSPAVKELHDIIISKRGLTFKITKKELSNFDLELVLGSEGVSYVSGEAGGQVNPLELQSATVKGWLKLQFYGRQSARDGNTPLLTVESYVCLKYDGDFAPGDELIEPVLSARQLISTLNTGNIA